MKHEWQVKRAMVEHPDGQRRWDRAYLCLLRWAHEQEETQPPQKQEASHESCPLRTSFDSQAGRNPNH
jgi:hypothetical protein